MESMVRLRQVMNQNLDQDLTIADDDPLELAAINSIAFIKIVIAIEDEFHIHFDNTMLDMKKYATLRDLCAYVEAQVSQETA